MRVVADEEIFCFVSRDHYTCVYFGKGPESVVEGICDLSLTRLAERLNPGEFRQLHRNNIVRTSAIVALARSNQGEVFVELSNGMKLPVSRSNQREAKELVKGGRMKDEG